MKKGPMKLSKKPDDLEKKGVKELKKFYKTYEELASASMTWMGALSMLMEFIVSNYSENVDLLPEKTKYGMALGMYHYKILGQMIRGDIKPEDFSMRFMPITEDAWTEKGKLNDRMVLIVKLLYMALKKEGKIGTHNEE